MLKHFVLLFIFAYANSSPNGVKYLESLPQDVLKKIHAEILEDTLLNATQLIEKNGYSAETHEIKTEDGYLITVHRIPKGKSNIESHKTPVLLMHGLMSSSTDWIVNGPGKSLGYILADAGYDVWLGNARGNYYSRKHVTLNPDKDHEFWDFSWDEIGYFDLPAMIDHILTITGRSKLHYVGHSQGGANFFSMTSQRPEYNEKVLFMQGLAPAVFMSHCKSVILKYLSPFALVWGAMQELVGVDEFSPNLQLTNYISDAFCSKDSDLLPLCKNLLFVLGGFDPQQLNATMIPVYMGQSPAGASSRQVIHYSQSYVTGKFKKLDRGVKENVRLYGSIFPPEYDLAKTTAPVALYYGESDSYVDAEDVKILHDNIGNPFGFYKVDKKEFNHLDFLWAMNAPTLVYEPVLKLMNEHSEFFNEISKH